jgi:hypothetical protein
VNAGAIACAFSNTTPLLELASIIEPTGVGMCSTVGE